MKVLLSLNEKFYVKNCSFFIQQLKQHDKEKQISGFEISMNYNDSLHQKFINELVVCCKKDNYYLQFHGNSSLDLNLQYKYLNYINKISKKLEHRVNLVLHPIESNSLISSLKETNIYFSSILNYIYEEQLNINVSIENLTSRNQRTLSKEVLLPILANNYDLNFTYDLGHEIFEYGNITDLNKLLINRLTNIHIHTFNHNFDHLPISKNSKNKEKWVKALLYLKNINYTGPIVLEYELYKLGDTYEEQLENYIKSTFFIKDYLTKKD